MFGWMLVIIDIMEVASQPPEFNILSIFRLRTQP